MVSLDVRADDLMNKLQGEDRQTLLDLIWSRRKAFARLDTIRSAVRDSE
jgi:hypothetical protein